jgi:hypothetical protein
MIDCMVVCLCFPNHPYTGSHTSLLMKRGQSLAAYCMFSSVGVFCKYRVNEMFRSGSMYSYHKMDVSAAEEDLIEQTCETCRKVKARQTMWDLMLENTPFDDTTEQMLHTASSVRPTELIVLILRACLDPANPVHCVLQSCNSRTVTPQELCALLRPHMHDVQFQTVRAWSNDFLARDNPPIQTNQGTKQQH